MSVLLRHKVLVAANNERGYLGRDLCCGISCHPSRLCSALDSPPCRGVSYVTKLSHLEPHPPYVNFIIVRALFEGGVNFAQQRSRVVRIYSTVGRNRGNMVMMVYEFMHCSTVVRMDGSSLEDCILEQRTPQLQRLLAEQLQ